MTKSVVMPMVRNLHILCQRTGSGPGSNRISSRGHFEGPDRTAAQSSPMHVNGESSDVMDKAQITKLESFPALSCAHLQLWIGWNAGGMPCFDFALDLRR